MAANVDRGEIDVRIGNQTRTLRFRTAEVAMLEERLEMEPLLFVGQQKGQTRFLIAAIFCGLSRTEKDKTLTPARVADWLDTEKDLDRSELQKSILYAIARGKNGEDAKAAVRALDEAFGEVEAQEAARGAGPLL